MAHKINSIGDFGFVSLRGEVIVPTEQLRVAIARPGVNGLGLWNTGVRGQPFQLRSAVDLPTLAGCQTALIAYRLLIGASPVVLVKDNYDYNAGDGFRVAVLAVGELEKYETPLIVGGINVGAGPGAKLVCRWDLLAMANA